MCNKYNVIICFLFCCYIHVHVLCLCCVYMCFICGQGHQRPDVREPQSPLQQQQQQVTRLCICYQSRRNCVSTSIIGLVKVQWTNDFALKGNLQYCLLTKFVGGAYHQKSSLIWTAYLSNCMSHDLWNLNFRSDFCRF